MVHPEICCDARVQSRRQQQSFLELGGCLTESSHSLSPSVLREKLSTLGSCRATENTMDGASAVAFCIENTVRDIMQEFRGLVELISLNM